MDSNASLPFIPEKPNRMESRSGIRSAKWRLGRDSSAYNLLIIVSGIVLAETIAMGVVYFYQHLPYYAQVLLDAAVMTVIITPLLYFLSTRPLLQNIRRRAQTASLLEARLRLVEFSTLHDLDELLTATLDEVEALTGSTIGYFHFLEDDQKTLHLKAWSTNTTQNMCRALGQDRHYNVDQAGVWADSIRQRKPIIHNNYAALPHRRGLPDGHAPILREMAVPILRGDKIVAILGIGNKPRDYGVEDVELVSTLADFAWDIVSYRQSADALRDSEEKFRTLVNWTYDWELWVDPHGNIIYSSPSCERMTGYSQDDFSQNPDLLVELVHPGDRNLYSIHYASLHDATVGLERMEYRILDRDGHEHWIEHVCRPLFGEDQRYLGRRVSNRDITERKHIERDIQERNQKEKMLTQTIHTMQLDIARDLHDTLGQNISFLRMKLDHLHGKKPRKWADMQLELQTMGRAADESYDLIRGTLAILQSTDSSDLYRLFTRYAEQIQERSNIRMDCSSQGEPRPLSAPRMRQLFYIYREVLNNIEKHAHADHVTMQMSWDTHQLNLVICDNGAGFDPKQVHFGSHYGLKFMRERVELLNGSLTVQSSTGTGTRVIVQIPYE